MLCTSCSQPVHPVVAVDLDGTLGDWHYHFQLFAEEWLGRTQVGLRTYSGGEPYRDWFTREYEIDLTTFRAVKLAFRQGGIKRSMPAFEHAYTTMTSLSRLAEVWVITTRPAYRYDRVDPDTVEWLRRHRIPYDGLLFDENKVYELYQRVDAGRVVAVLDDEPTVLEQVVRGTPILMRSHYNLDAEWAGNEVGTLLQAWDQMNRLLLEWNEARI
jgi:hypothetical protein